MSLGSEMRDEALIDEMIHNNRLISNCRNNLWSKKDGTTVSISKMELSHLVNTVQYLKRNIDYPCASAFIKKMEDEINSRQGGSGI